MPEALKPEHFQIVGKPWSLVFAPHPTVLDRQGVWLFNQETGEFWELIANTNFVLRPRQVEGGQAGERSRRRKGRR
jgi:hypothetical protein